MVFEECETCGSDEGIWEICLMVSVRKIENILPTYLPNHQPLFFFLRVKDTEIISKLETSPSDEGIWKICFRKSTCVRMKKPGKIFPEWSKSPLGERPTAK